MFGRLFGNKKRAAKNSAEPLPHSVASSILSVVGARSIPTMPAAAQRAFELSSNPEAEARDFVEVIEGDESLSARIIKIANSVYFERGKKSSTIEDAVLVIGVNELRSLLSATTLSELFPSRNPLRAQLWHHDIATAIIARALAQRLIPEKAETAFLGGLMHDLGKLLLLQRAPEIYAKVVKAVETQGKTFLEAETEILVFDHTQVGHLVAERWQFTEELTDILRNHHRAPTEEDFIARTPLSLALLVGAADRIVHSLGLGDPPTLSRLRKKSEEGLEEIFKLLRIDPKKQKESIAQLQKTFEQEFELYLSGSKSNE